MWRRTTRVTLLVAWLLFLGAVAYLATHPRLVAPLAARVLTRNLFPDGRGSVRLQIPGGQVAPGQGGRLVAGLEAVLKDHTSYGDAGALIPALHVVAGRKVTDLTSLGTAEQVLALAREELADLSEGEPVFFLIPPNP